MSNRDVDKQLAAVKAALTWLDTPYHHHARVKGAGVDCAQLIIAAAMESGIITNEQATIAPNYPVQWHLHNRDEKLLEVLESFGCVEIDKEMTQAGDIVCFQFGRVTSHLGIKINETQFIHARYDTKKVVINTMQHEWLDRWTKTYTFPGVING